MSPRGSLLLLAIAGGLLTVHSCIVLGGPMREAAVALCAFGLLVAAPVAVLAWVGSLSDRDEKLRQRRRRQRQELAEALLWQATLVELQRLAQAGGGRSEAAFATVASAPRNRGRPTKTVRRRVLALSATVASTLGLMGCFAAPVDNWPMVQPGMGTPELVSLIGAPDQIKSNGTSELWQYCRDFLGRNARYYLAVLVDSDAVQAVRPYPVQSNAGCEAFYRTGF